MEWSAQGLQRKIIVVINSLVGGGAERSLVELIPHYRAAGMEPIIACLKERDGDLQAIVRASRYRLVHLQGRRIPAWSLSLRKLIGRENAAMIHTCLFEADVVGRLAAIGTGVPVLTSLVNTPYERIRLSDPNISARRLHAARAIDAWTARTMTTHFHAISCAVRESAIRHLRVEPDRVTVIERGRDSSRLGLMNGERRVAARRSLGCASTDEIIVTVGRQEFQKGHTFLLEAVASILPQRPQLKLVIVGACGHATEQLLALHQRLDLRDRAVFLGYREDVPEILAAADLFVFPSLYEGLGGAIIEAMALGLPVVASDISGITEVVEKDESAVLVPPGSPKDLAVAIASLLSDRDKMRRLGGRGAAIFQQRFTLDKSATRMIELCEHVIARGRRGGRRDEAGHRLQRVPGR